MAVRSFLKTGIPGFDELFINGIPKSSIITLGGPSGCGKSSLAMQFLVEGARKFNEPGLYISLEDSKNSLLSSMSGYTWELEKMERNKQIFFLDYPISEVDQFLQKENAVGELISTMGIERVVIDSIMPIALSFKGEDERQSGLLNFISNIRKWKTTTFIVSEDTAQSADMIIPSTKYGIEKLTDGWVQLYYILDDKGNREKAVEVIKMKGTTHALKKFKCTISNEGFTIFSKSVSTSSKK